MAMAAGAPELLSLTTSAEQAAGRAALVVLIKSENGQNTSNAQSVGSQPGPHTHVLHVTGTGHLVRRKHCMFRVLSLLWALQAGNSSTWLKGEDQQPAPSLSCG